MQYWYKMLLRPVSIGCQPKDFIGVIKDGGRHGIVAFENELSVVKIVDYNTKLCINPTLGDEKFLWSISSVSVFVLL